jgi:hypothetical protein
MSSYDLTQNFYEKVDDLMFVVNQMIEANEQNRDTTVFLKDLFSSYQAVKEVQLQKEENDNIINKVLYHGTVTKNNF